jgi:hypothetical protein
MKRRLLWLVHRWLALGCVVLGHHIGAGQWLSGKSGAGDQAGNKNKSGSCKFFS